MSLYQTLGEHLKEAMKSGETVRRDTLRLLQSAIKNVAIEKRKAAPELADTEVEEVIKRLVKQRKDSIEQYRAGNREDLVAKEEAELTLLSAYLPEAMPQEELEVLVRETLSEAGLTSKAEMGQAMGLAMKKVAGRADGQAVRKAVEACLS